MIIAFEKPKLRILKVQLLFSKLLIRLGHVWLLVDFVDSVINVQNNEWVFYVSQVVQLYLS